MNSIRCYFSVCFLAFYFSFFKASSAQTSFTVPIQISKELDSLKALDNLEEWLYRRMDFNISNPRECLPFLMATQKEVWRSAMSSAEKEAWLHMLINQGYYQLYIGNILSSIDKYEEAYSFYYKNPIADFDLTEYILKPLGNNYTRLGDYERAIFIQNKSLLIAKNKKDKQLIASVYSNMATAFKYKGDLINAEKYVRLGLALAINKSPELILLRNTYADIQYDNQKYDVAEKLISINILQLNDKTHNSQSSYWMLSAYILAGDIQQQKNNFIAAQRYYQQALSIIKAHFNDSRGREKAKLLIQLGKLSFKMNKPGSALNYFDKALHVLIPAGLNKRSGLFDTKKLFGEYRLVEAFYQKALVYLAMNDNLSALQNMSLALSAGEKIRTEFTDSKTKQRFQNESKVIAEKAIEVSFDMWKQTGDKKYCESILSIAEQSKSRILLEEIVSNQQQFLKKNKDTLLIKKLRLQRAINYYEKQFLEYAIKEGNVDELKFELALVEKIIRQRTSKKGNIFKNISINNMLGYIPGDIKLLEFFVGKDHVYLIEIVQNKITQVIKLKNAPDFKKQILNFVSTYYHHGPRAMIDQPKRFFEHSYSLYQQLFTDIHLETNQKLIIIPDDVLGYLSFDGLITTDKFSEGIAHWPFLVKKATISYSYSIQTWVSQKHPKNAARDSFVGLFITHQGDQNKSLPAVESEIKSLKKIVRGQYIVDNEATVTRFSRAMSEATVFHISTHAWLSGEQKEPTLQLANDKIFLFELFAEAQIPRLVVLSACHTADGMMASGEGIISLSRGFVALGATGTIASLWNVNDDAAARITTLFYEHILKKNEVIKALHQSKIEWLAEEHADMLNLPYFWDSLIYIGHDQQIELKKASYKLPFYVLVLCLLIISALFYYKQRRPSKKR